MGERIIVSNDKLELTYDERYCLRIKAHYFITFRKNMYSIAAYLRKRGFEDDAALFIEKERLYKKINGGA